MNSTVLWLLQRKKAIGAFVTTALGAILLANADGHVTTNEWIWVVLTVLGATGTVHQLGNASSKK